MLSINTNTASMAAVNAINKSDKSLSKSMQRLATGNRINSSADDAAGKQIANRLQAQSDGMKVAMQNVSDATAMLQTADGMFDEMDDILDRMKDLATQAANGTYNDEDITAMQDEYDELGQQVADMIQNTTYGGTDLFNSDDGKFLQPVTFQVGAESSDVMTVDVSGELSVLVGALNDVSSAFTDEYNGNASTEGAELSDAGTAIDNISTAMKAVGTIQSQLGSSINRLTKIADNLVNMKDNTDVAVGTIMDTDYATEASNMTKQQMLMQTGITMLKQSNSMSSMVSNLLQ